MNKASNYNNDSLTHKAVKGFIWLGTGKGLRFLLQLIIVAILARLLDPAEFGLAAAALVVINFSEIFSRLGIGPALIQRSIIEEKHINTGFTFSILFGLLLTGMLIHFAPVISIFFMIEELTPVLQSMSVLFIIHAVAVVPESLLQRTLMFKWLAVAQLLSYLVGYGVVGIFLAYNGYGVWSLVAANLSQALIKCMVEFFGCPFRIKFSCDLRSLKELLFFGTGFTLASFFNYLATQGDYFVVGRWLGAGILGLYSRGYQIMALPAALFGDVLDKVLFPSMASIQDKPEKLAVVYLRGVTFISMLALPISSLMFILAPEVVLVLLGSNWVDIIIPIQILSWGMYFRASYKISNSLAHAAGAVYPRAWRQGIYAFLVIMCSWIGHHWGLTGVAYGIVFALAINFFLMAQLSMQLTNTKAAKFISAHVPAAVISSVLAVQSWVVTFLLRDLIVFNILVLTITLLMSGLTFFVLIWTFPGLLGKDGFFMLKLIHGYMSFGFINLLVRRYEVKKRTI